MDVEIAVLFCLVDEFLHSSGYHKDRQCQLCDAEVHLLPQRRKNSRQPLPPWWVYLQQLDRKRIETTFSLIAQRLPKCIHAVTAVGFELKVILFVLALSLSYFPYVATWVICGMSFATLARPSVHRGRTAQRRCLGAQSTFLASQSPAFSSFVMSMTVSANGPKPA